MRKPTIKLTRGDINIQWISEYCLRDSKPIVLSTDEIIALRRRYDDGQSPTLGPVLTACVALLHLCGVESRPDGSNDVPVVVSDVFSMAAAAGPNLSNYIKRDGDAFVCPELGTRHPSRAA